MEHLAREERGAVDAGGAVKLALRGSVTDHGCGQMVPTRNNFNLATYEHRKPGEIKEGTISPSTSAVSRQFSLISTPAPLDPARLRQQLSGEYNTIPASE